MEITAEKIDEIEIDIGEKSGTDEGVEELLNDLNKSHSSVFEHVLAKAGQFDTTAGQHLVLYAAICCKLYPEVKRAVGGTAEDLAISVGLHTRSENKPSVDSPNQVLEMLKNGLGWKLKSEIVADYLVDSIFELGSEEAEYSVEEREMLLCNLVAVVKLIEY